MLSDGRATASYNVTLASVTLFKKVSWFSAPAVSIHCDGGKRIPLPSVNSLMSWVKFEGNEPFQVRGGGRMEEGKRGRGEVRKSGRGEERRGGRGEEGRGGRVKEGMRGRGEEMKRGRGGGAAGTGLDVEAEERENEGERACSEFPVAPSHGNT